MKVITIGRQPDNMVVVNDSTVGRRHAQIIQHDDGHISIVDLSSKNGTFVNGKRILDEAPLAPGDQVQIGSTNLPWEGYLSQEPAPEKKKRKKGMLILSSVIAGLLCTAALCLVLVYTSRDNQGNSVIAQGEEVVFEDEELSADSIAYYKALLQGSLADSEKALAEAKNAALLSEKAQAEADKIQKEAADARAEADRANAEALAALEAAQNAQNEADKAKAALEYEKAQLEAKRKAEEAKKAEEAAKRKAVEAQKAKWREWSNTLAVGYIKIDKLYLYATSSYALVSAKEARRIQKNCSIGGLTGWRFPSALEISTIRDELIKYRREIKAGYGDGTYDAILYQNISDIIDNYSQYSFGGFWTEEHHRGTGKRKVVLVRKTYY